MNPEADEKPEPAYELMRKAKLELVRKGEINRDMSEGRQYHLVMRAMRKRGDEPGFKLDNFVKYVADYWEADASG